MIFWIVAALLTAGVVGALVRPLSRRGAPGPTAAESAVGIYKDQLAEVERDRDRGLLDEGEAAAARAEIGRRLLGAAALPGGQDKPVSARSPKMAALVAAAVPLLALAIYVPLGQPGLPSQLYDAARNRPPPDVAEAIAKLEARLKEQPEDPTGWRLLAQTYSRLGRTREALEAWRTAHRQAPDDANVISSLAEAQTVDTGGVVGEEAVGLFRQALDRDAKDPRARFYLGLARFQAGDWNGAIERWAELVRTSPADAPWLPTVRERLAEAAGKTGQDPATVIPEPLPAAEAVADAAGPNSEQGAAIAGLPPEQRAEAIRGMVDKLAARLKDNPGDVDGWLRLARARTVLGDRAAAEEAYRQASKAAPGRLDVMLAYAEFLIPEQGALPPAAVRQLRAVLERQPVNPLALYYLGQDAADNGRAAEARELWLRLLPILPEGPDRTDIERRLAALKP